MLTQSKLTPADIETLLAQRLQDTIALKVTTNQLKAGLNAVSAKVATSQTAVPMVSTVASAGGANVVSMVSKFVKGVTFLMRAIFNSGLSTSLIVPLADSTTAIKITKADGTTPQLTFDTSNGSIIIPNNNTYGTLDSAGTERSLIFMDASAPDVVHVRNNQRNAGGQIDFESGAAAGLTASLDGSGNFNVIGVFKVGGAAGVSNSLSLTPSASGITVNLNVSTTTIQYKDWSSSNQSVTIVTGVSVSSVTPASVLTAVSISGNAFTGGIKTT